MTPFRLSRCERRILSIAAVVVALHAVLFFLLTFALFASALSPRPDPSIDLTPPVVTPDPDALPRPADEPVTRRETRCYFPAEPAPATEATP